MIKNKNILITGATSGIGEALALHYARSGAANLFICGRNAERLHKVAEECRKLGTIVYDEILNVTDREALRRWIIKSDQVVPLNLVIANAGVGMTDESDDAVYETFSTNLFGVLNTVLPTIEIYRQRPKQTQQDKAIAVVSSMAGYHGLATCPAYSASKAGVKAWGEAMRLVLKPEGINLSVICPGFVRSRITDKNTCPMPFFMEAPQAAQIIAKGIEENKGIIAFPWPLRLATWLVSVLPNCLSDLIYGRLPPKA